MTIVDLQAWASSRITAVAELSALGAPFIFSPFDDERAVREAIEVRARQTGVVIEIGYPETGVSTDSASKRSLSEPATFEVYIREELGSTHTPNSLSLVTAVKSALTHGNDMREAGAAPQGGVTLVESGYVLHILTFSKNVTIP